MLEKPYLSKTMTFHRGVILLAAALAISSLVFFPGSSALGQDSPKLGPGEKAVALVNGIPIYPSDLNCAFEAALARKPHLHQETPEKAPGVLDRLIDIELLYQESLKHRFPGLVEETENAFEKEVRQAGSIEKLQATLACNGISLERFKKSIFRNTSIRRLLDEKVYSRITVSEDEIQEHYTRNQADFRAPESVKLRQIFIRIPSFTDEDAVRKVEDRARGIFRQAAEGEDFLSLARKHSDDPYSASSGGEMGVIFKGNLHKSFETLVFGQREGSVTEPIKSPSGFHIFQVVSISPPSVYPLEQVQDAIANQIRRLKARDMVSAFLSSLRENARIVVLDKEAQRGD